MKKGICVLIVGVLLFGIISALSFNDLIESDFNGIFNSTFYNSSGFVQVGNLSLDGGSEVIEMSGQESGVISYWRMNESSWSGSAGEVKEVLGLNNGTAVSGAITASGLFGNAGSFDGIDDYVSIANSEELNPNQNSFSISGWAKSSPRNGGATNEWQLYVAKRTSDAENGYYIGLNQGYGLNFMVGDGVNRYDTRTTNYVPVNYNEWFHFVAVINRTSNQILLYVNGSLEATRAFTTLNNINNTGVLSIGKDIGQIASQNGYPANGSVDELAFWDYALSSSEISALYEKGINSSQESQPTTGTYESEIKDAGAIVNWTNISWNGLTSYSLGDLPNNKGSDSSADMSGNVLLMHMDEESGAIVDFSGEGNNGAESGGVSYAVGGKYNSALGFDGNNDYLNIPHDASLNLGNILTIEAWVYPNSLSNRYVIYSTRKINPAGSFQLEIGTGNSHSGVVAVAGVNTWVVESENNAVAVNEWSHIVYTRNGTGTGSHRIYVNGQEKTLQTTSAYDFVDNSNEKMIGTGTSLLAMHYFPGKMDEVAIYNRALSSAEVLSHYNRNGTDSDVLFKLRTSNDNSSWTDYRGSDGTSTSYYSSSAAANISNSRFIQYLAYFSTATAKLYNFSLNYESIGDLTVSLDSLADNYLTNSFILSANCSASSVSELVNATLYHDFSGIWISQETNLVSGTSNTTSFGFVDITTGIHLWNCLFCNVDGTCEFASSNKTIILDNLAPTVSLVSPENDYNENSSQIVSFIFNATDERSTSLNCSLFVNGSEVASNSSVISGIGTTISSSLLNGNYGWHVNCSDGVNSEVSEERNVTIEVLSDYVPFWAKTNTHTHTTNSDGDSSLATVVSLYKAKDYNILAITDHGYVTNCVSFTNLSDNFICISSEEWTSTKHVVRVNVSTAYNNAAQYMQAAVNAANAEGGFAIAAHPNWSSTIWTVSDLTSLENYTAMEIYNKVIERLTPSPYAVSKWDQVLLTGKKIFGVAADDMHLVNTDLGYGFTKVYMPEFTQQAYIDSMRAGYFYSSQGPNMDEQAFELSCDGLQNYHMGETANCSAVSINTIVSATNFSYVMRNISLIKNGVVINVTSCSSENCTFNYSESVSSSGYYRLQASDSWNKQMWSNPIWVTKIALPVIISVNSPESDSEILDYTPLLNISLNQNTALWYNLDGGVNATLCNNCSFYEGYLRLNEGLGIINVYSNNSDNIVVLESVSVNLTFNQSIYENFEDNSSVESTSNVLWSNNKMSLGTGEMFGNFILKPIFTEHNITSFSIDWIENNTANAKGEGQRAPIILKYRINNSDWISFDSLGNYVVNGSEIMGLNGNNFSLMFDFEKNNETPIDLLSFNLTWTEFEVPLISDVEKSATTNTATINWVTSPAANSTVEYGTSFLLGSIYSSNESVANHTVMLSELSANTVYYYKIKSCTLDSCAEYPQSPFPLDNFVTQAETSVNPPGGGGGGGSNSGGSGGLIQTSYGLGLSKLSNLILNSGEGKDLVLNVKNSELTFLDNCKISGAGEYSSWVSSDEKMGLAGGQSNNFNFRLNVPTSVEAGVYEIGIDVSCDGASESASFNVEILLKELNFELIEVKRVSDTEVKIIYLLEDLSGISQEVEVQFLLLNVEGEEISEQKEVRNIEANSKGEFEIFIIIDEGISGDMSLLANLNSKTYSTFIQENVVLGAPISGFSIMREGTSPDSIFSIVLIVMFLGFGAFIVRRMFKHGKQSGVEKLVRKRKKSKK